MTAVTVVIVMTVIHTKTGWKLAPVYYVCSIIEMKVTKEFREVEQTGLRQPTEE